MVDHKLVGDYVIIHLGGRLDVHASAAVEKDIQQIIKNYPENNIIINLDNVEYMSSSGLRILVSTMRILKEKNLNLRLTKLNYAVKKVFEVVELMDMFEIYANDDEALNA